MTIMTNIHPRRSCPRCHGLLYYTDSQGIRRECDKPRCQRTLRELRARERRDE